MKNMLVHWGNDMPKSKESFLWIHKIHDCIVGQIYTGGKWVTVFEEQTSEDKTILDFDSLTGTARQRYEAAKIALESGKVLVHKDYLHDICPVVYLCQALYNDEILLFTCLYKEVEGQEKATEVYTLEYTEDGWVSEYPENVRIEENNVFVAVYNETSFDDILSAVNSGKSVLCSYTVFGGTVKNAILVSITDGTYATFTSGPSEDYPGYLFDKIQCDAIDGWGEIETLSIPDYSDIEPLPKIFHLLAEPKEIMSSIQELAATGLTPQVIKDVTEGKYAGMTGEWGRAKNFFYIEGAWYGVSNCAITLHSLIRKSESDPDSIINAYMYTIEINLTSQNVDVTVVDI